MATRIRRTCLSASRARLPMREFQACLLGGQWDRRAATGRRLYLSRRPDAVEAAHGVPADAAGYAQSIESLASSKYAGTAGTAAGQVAVSAAESALGTPYQWGGSCTDPHGADPAGWCDCSSLVQMAWAAAGMSLPRTTYDQVHVGTPVASVSELQPGDLIFIPGSDGSAASPGHVGVFVGGGYLINAPQAGQVVRFATVSSWQTQIVAMRHIG